VPTTWVKEDESQVVMLIESPKKDKATSKPSNAQQVKPGIIKRYRESDKENNPWENKKK
jgi:hypothetical protein